MSGKCYSGTIIWCRGAQCYQVDFYPPKEKIHFPARILSPAKLFWLQRQVIFFDLREFQKIYHPLVIHRRHVTQGKNRPRKRKIWDVGKRGASPGGGAVWDNSDTAVLLQRENRELQELGLRGTGETSRVKNIPEKLRMEEQSYGERQA